MGRISLHELRRMGVSAEDIEAAKVTQLAQRRTGSPVQSIGVIVGAVEPRRRTNPNLPADLTDRAMRARRLRSGGAFGGSGGTMGKKPGTGSDGSAGFKNAEGTQRSAATRI